VRHLFSSVCLSGLRSASTFLHRAYLETNTSPPRSPPPFLSCPHGRPANARASPLAYERTRLASPRPLSARAVRCPSTRLGGRLSAVRLETGRLAPSAVRRERWSSSAVSPKHSRSMPQRERRPPQDHPRERRPRSPTATAPSLSALRDRVVLVSYRPRVPLHTSLPPMPMQVPSEAK
jgi:hypothetical protein